MITITFLLNITGQLTLTPFLQMCTLTHQGPRLYFLKFNNFIIIIRFILFNLKTYRFYSVNSLCLAHLYLKLLEYTLCLDPVYNCTVILFLNLCTHFASPSYSSKTCPLLLLVLTLTNGIPSKITLMNRVDQSQGSKCVTHTLTHTQAK